MRRKTDGTFDRHPADAGFPKTSRQHFSEHVESCGGSIIHYRQTLFNTAFETMVQFQNQVEKMGNSMMAQADWLPDESRKICDKCVDAYKTSCNPFKSYVDEGYRQSEKLFK